MIILLGLSSAFCGLMACLCVFGQLFVGRFLPTATAMALCGAACAVCGLALMGGRTGFAKAAMLAGALGALSVGADAAYYYKHLHFSGNYYAWFMFAPYAAAMALVGACGFFVKDAPPTWAADRGR